MLREIGGNFWVDQEFLSIRKENIKPDIFGVCGCDFAWLSTGRAATAIIIDTIEHRNPRVNKVALIPAFTCYTVAEAFINKGYVVETFEIDLNMNTYGKDLLQKSREKKPGILLIHRYFGFDTLRAYEKEIKAIQDMGIIIVEDKTQSLFSEFKCLEADYIVASVRKWCGIPDGGFAVCKEGMLYEKPKEKNLALEKTKIEAGIMKYNYIYKNKGDKKKFLEKYKEAERIIDFQNEKYTISDTSIKMLEQLDMKKLKSKRKTNYLYLLNTLKKAKEIDIVFNEWCNEITPLYFPIKVKKQKLLQKFLACNDVYAPIIWPKPECIQEVGAVADSFYSELLCLPIDQRYDLDDMQRVANCIFLFIKSTLMEEECFGK